SSHPALHSFPTRRSSDLIPFYFCSGAELPLVRELIEKGMGTGPAAAMLLAVPIVNILTFGVVSRWLGARGALNHLETTPKVRMRSEEHTSELQSRFDLVC